MSDEQNVGVSDRQPTENSEDTARSSAPAEEVIDKADEYLRMAQRAQADLVNYRRRVDQERDEVRGAAKIDAVMAMLPVLDDFERAITAIPEDHRSLGWVQGILLIERNLRGLAEKAGLERIDAQGKAFDPHEHEAVMTEESGELDEDTITHVIRPGYRSGNRVIRPAQVAVSRKPSG